MKIFLLLCLATFLSFVSMGQSSRDEQLVREVVKSFVNDYNNGDFKNASLYTTNDWVHINPGGGITRGREDVLKEVRAIHQTMLKGVRITIDTMTIRFVTADPSHVVAMRFARRSGLEVVLIRLPVETPPVELLEHANSVRTVDWP